MKNKKTTIEIGISALNEEANIGSLLDSLLRQELSDCALAKITVISDGSTDRTFQIARSRAGGLIGAVDGRRRLGLAARQNQLFAAAQADILVLLDADIAVMDPHFLEKLARPVVRRVADISSGRFLALGPRSLTAKALAAGVEMKSRAFAAHQGGDNIYACYGVARAFSRRFYREFRFFEDSGEDMQGYLFAKENGFRFALAKEAYCRVRMPESLADHARQSLRFMDSQERLARYFPREAVSRHLRMPWGGLARQFVLSLARKPISTLYYLAIFFLMKIRRVRTKPMPELWEAADSTKAFPADAEPDAKFLLFLFFRRALYGSLSVLGKLGLLSYPRVIVLAYHSVGGQRWRFTSARADFEKQVEHLLKERKPISLERLEAYVRGEEEIAEPSFALTFDDGYRDNLELAEYLKAKGIAPAVFVLAEPDRADRAALDNRYALMADQEVLALKAAGWEIGCHGLTHRDPALLDKDELAQEIGAAKRILEGKTASEARYFSYPFGRAGGEARLAAKTAGYRLAFSLDDFAVKPGVDRYNIPRTGIDGTHKLFEFKAIYSRQAMLARKLIKSIPAMLARRRAKPGRETGLSGMARMFFANRLVTVARTARLPLPERIGEYSLAERVHRPLGDDQYQFGVYRNGKGEQGILKMWDGTKKDGDWFWLMNEIRAYEGLQELFRLNGEQIREKFPRVRLPRFIQSFEDKGRLGLFTEMITGETLDKEGTMAEAVARFEEAISYFRYLGELIAWSGLEDRFVRRNNFHTTAIFCYMILRAAWAYPPLIPALGRAMLAFARGLPRLIGESEIAFVHRDLTYMNVLKLEDGRTGIIDFELAVLANPLYEITQAVTGSWHLDGFWQEFYRLETMRAIFSDKSKAACYRVLTIFTAVHRLATSPRREFPEHYSYLRHGLALAGRIGKTAKNADITLKKIFLRIN